MDDFPAFVVVGQILRPWGTRGAVRLELTTDFPQRFTQGSEFYLNGQRYRCEQVRVHHRAAVLKLQGVDSLGQAEALRGCFLEVPTSQLPPLPEGTFFRFQILGMEVWTSRGHRLGRVEDVLETGANDVFVVRDGGREVLIPAIDDVVRSVDVAGGRITVEALPGLLE
jgi:16S rRNA processing protein RimM